MATHEEIMADLVQQFTAWKEEIIRLLSANAAGSIKITKAIEGLTWAEIQEIIDDELYAHFTNKLAHNVDILGLGGMTRESFDALLADVYPKYGMPFSQAKNVQYTVAGTTVTFPDTEIFHEGFVYELAGVDFTITNTARKWWLIKIEPQGEYKVAKIYLVDNQNEDLDSFIIGHVQLVGGVPQMVIRDVTRIGDATISTTPRGRGIPASPGTPASTGTIDSGWFVSP